MIGSFKYAWFLAKTIASDVINFLQTGDIDGGAAGDQSGYSVSMNSYGNVLAIGAPSNDGIGGAGSGQVRIYRWDGANWKKMGSDIDGEAAGYDFGRSISLNAAGDIVAIGEPGWSTSAGRTRICRWNGIDWVSMGAILGISSNEYLGHSVSLNAVGDRVAIGVYGGGGTVIPDRGDTKIYNWNGTAWEQMGSNISGEAEGDNSGYSVSLNDAGDRVAIGAILNDDEGRAGQGKGHTRIYRWSGTGWAKMGLDIDGEAEFDYSGWSVSLNARGDRVAVGAIFNDGSSSGSDRGHARIYRWDGSSWTQMGSDIDGETASDRSGWSVSLNADGNFLAIGAPGNDGGGSTSGHVRIYRWDGSDWIQMGIDIDGEASNDESGTSVSLNAAGTKLAIGAPYNDGNGSNSGHVRVYSSDTELPNGLIGSPMTSLEPNSKSGYSISINNPGDIVAFGEPYSPGGGTNRGTARIFQLSESNWNQLGGTLSGLADNDNFGWSISLNSGGNRIAIGAPFNDAGGTNRGVTRIMQLSTDNVWAVLGAPISGSANNDYLGYSVALNSLGNRVIMGVPNSAGGGTLRGSARVYQYNGTAWGIMGTVINGEANNDAYGTAVAINALGDVIAIGAPLNDGGGVDAGHVRVFAWSAGAWVQRGTDINGLSAGVNLGQYISLNDYGDVIAIGAPKGMDGAGYTIVYRWNNTSWEQLGNYIIGEAANDNSGSVYLNSTGKRLIIGAPSNDTNRGHLRVYDLSGADWILNTEINGNNVTPGHGFGYSVGVNFLGDIVTASSISGDGGYTTVYKITPPNISWNLATLLGEINGEASIDNSGWSVSLNAEGNVLAIGAILNDGSSGIDRGHTRIYSWDGSSWTKMGSDIDGETAGDNSGYSVSMNAAGDRVAVGAYLNDGSSVADRGHTRIYSWNGIGWTQMGSDIDGEAANNYSGYSVSLNDAGDRVAIGAILNDGSSGADSGHVRIYSWNGSNWTQMGSDIDGEAAGDNSGISVSLNDAGDRVAIGAPKNDSNGLLNKGHVRIYSWNGSNWTQMGSDIDGEAAGDNSGRSVSMNAAGDRVAVGAYLNDGNGADSGHVRVYGWNGSDWVQIGSNINGEAAGDYFGWSVSMNAAGDRVAVGAYLNDGNGADSGHVRVYGWNGSDWVQIVADINGKANGDYFGWSVSLNDAGDRVAIGAPYNDDGGANSGQTRIYQLS